MSFVAWFEACPAAASSPGTIVPVHVHCTVLPWYSNTCTVDEGIIGNSNTIMLGKWYYAVIPQKWNYAPENAGIMRSGQPRVPRLLLVSTVLS